MPDTTTRPDPVALEARVERAMLEMSDALHHLSRYRQDTTYLITRVRPQTECWTREITELVALRAMRQIPATHCPRCGRVLQTNGLCRIGCQGDRI
jgi:hypothetical protein